MNNRNYSKLIVLLCAVTYFISYVTRINYGSVIVEIVRAKGITNSAASAVVTGGFITYGAGQLVSGYMGDRLKPVKLVFCGLLVTVVMNIIMPLCKDIRLMTGVWCVNGFAQAFMWPPMVKYLTNTLSREEYHTACVKVGWGSSAGTIAVYLLSPVCVKFLSWEYVFFISAGAGFIIAFVWYFMAGYLEKKSVSEKYERVVKKAGNEYEKLSWTPEFTLMMAGVMLAIMMQGMVRDGVTTWMPTYIAETYNLSSSISILTGIILPVFTILSFQVTLMIYRKWIRNELSCASVIFGVGSVMAFLLFVLNKNNAVISVLLSAFVTAAMHGVNLMLISLAPACFEKYGRVSFMSGLLNSCTYVGSALSGYAMALIADNFGWSAVIFLWALISTIGCIVTFSVRKPWQKLMR